MDTRDKLDYGFNSGSYSFNDEMRRRVSKLEKEIIELRKQITELRGIDYDTTSDSEKTDSITIRLRASKRRTNTKRKRIYRVKEST